MDLQTPYQNLGKRTLVVMLVTKLVAPVLLFLLVIFIGALKGPMTESINQLSSTADPIVIDRLFNLVMVGASLLILIIALLTFLITWLEYANYKFAHDDHFFSVKRGILHLEEFSIPYNKIQNVEIERPLWYRFFGVSKLVVTTAGKLDPHDTDEHSEGVLDLIDKTLASKIQQELLQHSNIQKIVHHS